jgi:hypothetical protein
MKLRREGKTATVAAGGKGIGCETVSAAGSI